MTQDKSNRLPEWVKAALLAAEANGGYPPFPPPEPPREAPSSHAGVHRTENRDDYQNCERDPEGWARYESRARSSLPIRMAVGELADTNHFSEAYRLVRADLIRHPEHFFHNSLDLCRTALVVERYDEAEAICLRHVESGGLPVARYVELSLAIAEQGRLYAGQAEYSGRALRQAYGGSPLEGGLRPKWTEPQGAEAVAIACRLALGNTWSNPWRFPLLERVLEREPTCEVAALLLADGYGWAERKADALRVLDIAIDHAASSAGRDELVSVRDQVEAEGRYRPTPRAYLPTSTLNDSFLKAD